MRVRRAWFVLVVVGALSAGGCGSDDPQDEWEPGQVINGTCAPEGESFLDHYSCQTVEGPDAHQDPITVSHVEDSTETLADPDYDWVKGQIDACSCAACCHREHGKGSYIWSGEHLPAWTASASADALETLGGLYGEGAPSGAFTIPPEENNGFRRDETGHPTTDPERFRAFLMRELERR